MNPGLSATARAAPLRAVLLLPLGHDFIMWRVGPVMHDTKLQESEADCDQVEERLDVIPCLILELLLW